MDSKPGSIIGGTLLIAGSCIGAGMLALPILTGLAGFFPSLLIFLAAWLFMTITALLLIEVNGWFTHDVNIVSMATHSLGYVGKAISWILYLFLFYALLVAYVSGSGSLAATFCRTVLNVPLPAWLGSVFFVALFGWVVYLGTRPVDLSNRFLMAAKIISYIGLVFLGVKAITPQLLLYWEPSYALVSLPVLVISFGYHNMIPTLVSYMKGDLKRVKIAILSGSLFALLIYLIWEVIVLGIVPINTIQSSLQSDQEASQALATILGSHWISNFAQALAFFAILTSFLAQALSLVHFLADGLRVKDERKESLGLCALALAPPLLIALIYPQIFFRALNFAGGFCAVILFGILPALMVWIGRYRKKIPSTYQVPGGKLLLLAVFLFSFFILFLTLREKL